MIKHVKKLEKVQTITTRLVTDLKRISCEETEVNEPDDISGKKKGET